jgi:hypothetical protein
MDIEDFVPGKSTSSVQTLLHESWHKIHYGEFEKLITAEKREGMNKLIKDLAEKHPDTNQFELWERIKQAMTELGAERATDRLMQTPRMADADFKKWRKFWQEFYFGDFIKKYGKDEYLKFEKFAQRAADEYINAKGIKHIPDGKIPPKMQKAVDNAVERYVGEYRKQQLAQKALSYTSKNVPLRLGATVAKGRVSADGRAAERPTAERAPQSVRTTGRISAERITAERIAPDRISPDRVSAERVSPDRITPDRVSPERVTPERVTPERVSPERVSPERISPERVTPERIAPDRITPDRITPERVTPERITPDRITPDRITPDRITPDRITPDTPRIRITPDITRIITHIQEHSEHKKLDPKQFEGMLAWKQGFVYQIRWKPFGKNDVFYSREPIPEVKYFDGIGSAAKSAVALYGEIPKQVRVDMGIIDVNIFRGKDMDKPVLNFKADPKQKTHYTGIEKQSGSIKKSR